MSMIYNLRITIVYAVMGFSKCVHLNDYVFRFTTPDGMENYSVLNLEQRNSLYQLASYYSEPYFPFPSVKSLEGIITKGAHGILCITRRSLRSEKILILPSDTIMFSEADNVLYISNDYLKSEFPVIHTTPYEINPIRVYVKIQRPLTREEQIAKANELWNIIYQNLNSGNMQLPAGVMATDIPQSNHGIIALRLKPESVSFTCVPIKYTKLYFNGKLIGIAKDEYTKEKLNRRMSEDQILNQDYRHANSSKYPPGNRYKMDPMEILNLIYQTIIKSNPCTIFTLEELDGEIYVRACICDEKLNLSGYVCFVYNLHEVVTGRNLRDEDLNYFHQFTTILRFTRLNFTLINPLSTADEFFFLNQADVQDCIYKLGRYYCSVPQSRVPPNTLQHVMTNEYPFPPLDPLTSLITKTTDGILDIDGQGKILLSLSSTEFIWKDTIFEGATIKDMLKSDCGITAFRLE